MSEDSDRIWFATSVDVATRVLCASRAPPSIDVAVAEPAAAKVRSTSADSDLIWFVASADAVISVVCASRALFSTEAAALVPTAVNAVSTSAEASFS